MTNDTTFLCEICKERNAYRRCFLCERYICDHDNYGWYDSRVHLIASVRDDYCTKVIDIEEEHKLVDCCPKCICKLREIMENKKDKLEKILKEYFETLKSMLLYEIDN